MLDTEIDFFEEFHENQTRRHHLKILRTSFSSFESILSRRISTISIQLKIFTNFTTSNNSNYNYGRPNL